MSDVFRGSELARTGGRNGSALERGIFVDGAVRPLRGDALTITNPGTGEPVGRVTNADAATVDEAVRSAHAAFPDWARRGHADRGAILRAGADALREQVEALVPGLVAEQGKTIREATIELHKAAETLEHYAGLATTVLPHTSAGPSLLASSVVGKFHGTIAATTPSGRRSTRPSTPGSSPCTEAARTCLASPA